MTQWNTHAFSIVIALGISLIFSVVWLYVMTYIVPFSRSTVNIEQATIAQYQAFSWIEQSLRLISQQEPWFSTTGFIATDGTLRRVDYNISWEWIEIPRLWTWNGFQSDNNRLSQIEPIQLQIGDRRIRWNFLNNRRFRVTIRIPNFWWINHSLHPNDNTPMILWQVSSLDDTLVAAPSSMFTAAQINAWITDRNLLTETWIRNSDWASETFWSFYSANCQPNPNPCVFRMTLINPLRTSNRTLPYLDYSITLNAGSNVPYQITDIQSLGVSYWFQRSYNVRVPQATTSAAFDFTVFQ